MTNSEIARFDDTVYGYCVDCEDDVDGKIVQSSLDVICEEKGVARDGDEVESNCDHKNRGTIQATTETVKVNDRLVARKGDPFVGSKYYGTITGSASKTYAG